MNLKNKQDCSYQGGTPNVPTVFELYGVVITKKLNVKKSNENLFSKI